MAAVSLRKLSKRYDDGTEVIRGVDLEVGDGEFMVFVGPSGCGKSTLMRMIAGLEPISGGELRIGGRRVNELPPAARQVAMVFQSYALYPHMTVAESMGFALKLAGRRPAEVRTRVAEVAGILRLEAVLDRRPAALSGGQRQRVAIGRAIVREPQVFLFDEPLSNLDAALRVQMRVELTRLHRELGTTMIYVTHDQTEAMTMGQRIAVFDAGRIEQVGAPMALYRRPDKLFVAQFLGSPRMNVAPAAARRERGRLWLDSAGARGLAAAADAADEAAFEAATRVGVRPESLTLAAAGDAPGWDARVDLVERLGDTVLVHARIDGVELPFAARLTADAELPAIDAPVRLAPAEGSLHLFDAAGRLLSIVGRR